MLGRTTRREFVCDQLAAGAAVCGFGFLGKLPAVSAEDAAPTSKAVRLSDDIEPLVNMLESTPRDRAIEAAAEKVLAGTSYQQMLAATFLAGVRNIYARPVGFEFHCVLAIHSAHQAALASPDRDRWLPLFWAIDNFKDSQAVKKNKGSWEMPALDEAAIPAASVAKARFIEAMDRWDVEGTDVAAAGLARSAGAGELFELLANYGMRDFRHIGHKAIYVANAFRTLHTIGFRHAEPVLRSVAFALLEYDGANPSTADLEPDRPYRENLERAAKIRSGWQRGNSTPEASVEMLEAVRTGSHADASGKCMELLNRSIDPASVWDGVFLAAGEIMMRQPGIVALHSVTTCNALHHFYVAAASERTRLLALLQAAAFTAMFARSIRSRGTVREELKIDRLKAVEPEPDAAAAVEKIFNFAGKEKLYSAKLALGYLERGGPAAADSLMLAGRRLLAAKGRDSHDYKFSSAIMEDFRFAHPKWRSRYLASSLFWLKGSRDPDNALIARIRTALA